MTAVGSSVLLLLMAFGSGAGQTSSEVPTFRIEGPTVIAFFRPVTDAELEKDPDTNEVLSDFQLYASQAAPRMKRAGIDFEVVSAVRFRLKDRGVVHTFTARKIGVGYYFAAPRKNRGWSMAFTTIPTSWRSLATTSNFPPPDEMKRELRRCGC